MMIPALILFPVFAATALFLLPSERQRFAVSAILCTGLSLLSITRFFAASPEAFYLPYAVETLIEIADIVMLLFFLREGLTAQTRPVTLLALIQLPLYLWAVAVAPIESSPPVIADALSYRMFLIINIVGGLIVLYAVRYMRDETMDEARKRRFIVYLMLFLSVMNAIVIANSLLLFFFLFELTTLASYLLIGFRGDETARENALRALWMNQVGGVMLLLGTLAAIYGFETATFSGLLSHEGGPLLLAVSLLALAAPVKGASLPFERWLIGAMVAPTPVSAILHSATMVKIAPYLVLKLSPALALTLPGTLLSLFGALVFTAASYLALDRTYFKEILGYSTIALLGLMMSLAAIGTPESLQLAFALMLFHALSKALLFLAAGVLEKRYGLKDISQMAGLVHCAPRTVAFILLGFVSLTLPPFGLFMGKLFAIASVAEMLPAHPWMIGVLLGIAVGSVLLVMLYFKVAAALLSSPSDIVQCLREPRESGFELPMAGLALLTVAAAGAYLFEQPGGSLWLFAVPLLFLIVLPYLLRALRRFDRVAPYQCGEKADFGAALFYVSASAATVRRLQWGAAALLIAVIMAGACA